MATAQIIGPDLKSPTQATNTQPVAAETARAQPIEQQGLPTSVQSVRHYDPPSESCSEYSEGGMRPLPFDDAASRAPSPAKAGPSSATPSGPPLDLSQLEHRGWNPAARQSWWLRFLNFVPVDELSAGLDPRQVVLVAWGVANWSQRRVFLIAQRAFSRAGTGAPCTSTTACSSRASRCRPRSRAAPHRRGSGAHPPRAPRRPRLMHAGRRCGGGWQVLVRNLRVL